MARLILVPQFPTKMRYQEWWYTEFQKEFARHFDRVITLGKGHLYSHHVTPESDLFAPGELAINHELQQIKEYMELPLQEGDVLLLNDLSYPGLFAGVLAHKRPDKAYAICHGTSKNKYDIYQHVREAKWPIERGQSKLFNKIFVATEYHKEKLGWKNIVVQPFPLPPFPGMGRAKTRSIINVARSNVQKRTASIEKYVEDVFGAKIITLRETTWDNYYHEIAKSKVMLITSKEETYGYQVIDAITNGCVPIARNDFSYPELLPSEYLYSSRRELIDVMMLGLTNNLPVPKLKVYIQARNFYDVLALIMNHGT